MVICHGSTRSMVRDEEAPVQQLSQARPCHTVIVLNNSRIMQPKLTISKR